LSARILALIHQEDARSGVFGELTVALGHELEEASLALDRPPSRLPHLYDAVMVFGGGMNVDEEDRHPWLRDERALIDELLRRERPLLGVCLGAQLVAQVAGARVGRAERGPEIGWHEVELLPGARGDPLLGSLPARFSAFEWHLYGFEPPPGAVELARTAVGSQAYRVDGAPAWGIQFHAEVTRATLGSWLGSYSRDADARAAGVDPERLAAQNEREVGRWNELGRVICRGFLDAAIAR